MRWTELFRDLEGQWEAAESAVLADEVADRTRRELARIRLVDRLRAGLGREIAVTVSGAGVLRGVLADCGPEWLLLEEHGEALVSLRAVLGLSGLGPAAAAGPGSEGEVSARSGLARALRALARDRSEVLCVLVDGSACSGTVQRVGADHVELAEHPPGEHPRRPDAGLRVLPFGALAVLRRRT